MTEKILDHKRKEKPSFTSLIEKKRDGGEFTADEIRQIVDSLQDDSKITVTAYEMSTGETPLLSGVLPVDDAGYLVIGDKGADLYRPK